jgi:hypothetical protein
MIGKMTTIIAVISDSLWVSPPSVHCLAMGLTIRASADRFSPWPPILAITYKLPDLFFHRYPHLQGLPFETRFDLDFLDDAIRPLDRCANSTYPFPYLIYGKRIYGK